MKLSEIAKRGAAKDFLDPHALINFRQINVAHALHECERKFATHDSGSVIRSLAYFGDAEAEPLPRGLPQDHWRSMQEDVCAWVRASQPR